MLSSQFVAPLKFWASIGFAFQILKEASLAGYLPEYLNFHPPERARVLDNQRLLNAARACSLIGLLITGPSLLLSYCNMPNGCRTG